MTYKWGNSTSGSSQAGNNMRRNNNTLGWNPLPNLVFPVKNDQPIKLLVNLSLCYNIITKYWIFWSTCFFFLSISTGFACKGPDVLQVRLKNELEWCHFKQNQVKMKFVWKQLGTLRESSLWLVNTFGALSYTRCNAAPGATQVFSVSFSPTNTVIIFMSCSTLFK